jgi:hypothetical protein
MASMAIRPPYGPTLSTEEHERRLVALHSALPPVPTRAQRTATRRAELELAIDRRLGVGFPQDRREALWAVAERVERRRLGLVLLYLLRRLVPGLLPRGARSLARFLVRDYGKVLTPDELVAFFGEDEVRNPDLPAGPRDGG